MPAVPGQLADMHDSGGEDGDREANNLDQARRLAFVLARMSGC
jgi:hypothetical protein